MASEELRRSRLQRAKNFAERERKLPAIAEKADDLQAIKDSVDSAATVSGALWLSYLFVMFYIAVAAGAVTHEDLLLQRPVKLPFLNVELPLLAFFFLAPILFVATHIYTIVHFNMLGQKAARFHAELHHQLGDEKEIRDKLRRLLPSNVLVQIFAGPPELRDGRFGLIMKAIVILTLVACPVLLLLLLQIQFLPHHTGWITWTQRGMLTFDIAILWILRPPTLLNGVGGWSFHGGEAETAPKLVRVMRGAGLALTGVLSLLAIWLSVVVATIPDEWQETNLAALDPRTWSNPSHYSGAPLISTRELLFAGEVDAVTRRRKSLFSNTLVLPGFDIYEALKVDDKKKLDWKDHLIDLRGRTLDRAVFSEAKLPKADLTGAQLQGASLDSVQLQGAVLDGAQLQGASLNVAQLQGVSLVWAQLQGARLDFAQLQGAVLDGAQLQGALLLCAQLQGASLISARLQGASLDMAQLQGAALDEAQLQGASLDRAQLQGATLDRVRLQGASLEGAYLWRVHWAEWRPNAGKLVQFAQAKWEAAYSRLDHRKWEDVPWTDQTYDDLRKAIEALPQGVQRDRAQKRIARLDCQMSSDDIAPCRENAETPRKAPKLRALLEAERADGATYKQELAVQLRQLVCAPDENAIHILRAVGVRRLLRIGDYRPVSRFDAVGREAPALIDDILRGHDCLVSAALTESDETRLQEIKAEALKKYPSALPPAAAKEGLPVAASPAAPPVKASVKGDGLLSPRVLPPP
jgi:uncharacterized protein YjbI with pentapeptide repeats